MAATLTTEPASPASAYRPLVFEVTRTDPATSRVFFIRAADAADVIALGNGLVEGDMLMQHQAWAGSVLGDPGQTVNLVSCGDYTGLTPEVLTTFTVAGDIYSTIDVPDLGEFAPVFPIQGSARVWLNGYTVWCEVSTYTDPSASPQIDYLSGTPNLSGVTVFNVAPVVSDYFSNEVAPYVIPWGGTLIQHAHGITALFYRVRFREVYDVPGVTAAVDPWTDGGAISADTEHRVAVNAVHPYHSDLLTWETAHMEAFQIGTASAKFMTYAPRTITLADTDSFRVHLLTNPAEDYELTGGYNINVRRVNADGSTTALGNEAVDLGANPYAAISLAVGPADLAPFFAITDRYQVKLLDRDGVTASETLEVIVDAECKEVRRPLAWLSKLGGVDLFTFTGREIESSTTSRTTVRKPMGTGVGYDWSERGNTSNPASSYLLSTAPISMELRQWIARDLGQAAVTALKLSATQVTTIILTTGSLLASNTAGVYKPVTIEYRRGTDNLVQQA